MAKLALNPREATSLLRLAGQTFTSKLKKRKLSFSVERENET